MASLNFLVEIKISRIGRPMGVSAKAFIAIGAILFTSVCMADGSAKPEVKAFIESADLCEHFAGEWDTTLPKKEQRRIEKAVDHYCAQAQKQMLALKKRYPADKELIELMGQYESVASYQK